MAVAQQEMWCEPLLHPKKTTINKQKIKMQPVKEKEYQENKAKKIKGMAT